MRQKIIKIMKRILQAVLLALLVLILIYSAYTYRQNRTKLDYFANLDKTAVTVDGRALTLEDLGFYILFEEQQIEEKAEIYNAKYTKDFWNIHVNGIFIQSQAKKAALEMAVHDEIFYEEAMKDGIALTSEEKKRLDDVRTDFWSDLYDTQKERIPGTYDTVNTTMRKIALAEKYQTKLAKQMNTSYAGLNWDGYDYEQSVLPEHEVKENKKVWEHVVLGDITLVHTTLNYINGIKN